MWIIKLFKLKPRGHLNETATKQYFPAVLFLFQYFRKRFREMSPVLNWLLLGVKKINAFKIPTLKTITLIAKSSKVLYIMLSILIMRQCVRNVEYI